MITYNLDDAVKKHGINRQLARKDANGRTIRFTPKFKDLAGFYSGLNVHHLTTEKHGYSEGWYLIDDIDPIGAIEEKIAMVKEKQSCNNLVALGADKIVNLLEIQKVSPATHLDGCYFVNFKSGSSWLIITETEMLKLRAKITELQNEEIFKW